MVDAVESFHFDPKRLQRMIDLTSFGHNHAHLALTLERKRWQASLDWDKYRDPEAAQLIAWLNSRAKEIEPEDCHHLPDPPPELLARATAAMAARES